MRYEKDLNRNREDVIRDRKLRKEQRKARKEKVRSREGQARKAEIFLRHANSLLQSIVSQRRKYMNDYKSKLGKLHKELMDLKLLRMDTLPQLISNR